MKIRKWAYFYVFLGFYNRYRFTSGVWTRKPLWIRPIWSTIAYCTLSALST